MWISKLLKTFSSGLTVCVLWISWLAYRAYAKIIHRNLLELYELALSIQAEDNEPELK